jgi:hypothetical protein
MTNTGSVFVGSCQLTKKILIEIPLPPAILSTSQAFKLATLIRSTARRTNRQGIFDNESDI